MRSHTDEIQRAIQLLETFAPQNIDFSQIWIMLYLLEMPGDIAPAANSLRELLNIALRNDSTKNNLPLIGAIWNVLHALAKFSPINPKDPFSLSRIEPDKRVVVSGGHQFDIDNLMKWHYKRNNMIKGDSARKKWLLNPCTRAPFSPIDVLHIQAIAESKNITIANLKRDPALKLADCLWNTLAELAPLGLTVYHLISLPCPSLSFGQPDALHYLMIQEHLSPEETVRTINDLYYLSHSELGYSRVISRELLGYIPFGLKIEHLRSIQIPKEDFPFSSYFDTLRYLLTKEKNPPLDAIVKLNDFYTQAFALEFPPAAYSELITLIGKGFTIEHLSRLQLHKKDFSGADKDAINYYYYYYYTRADKDAINYYYYSRIRENNTLLLYAIAKLNQFYSQALELGLSPSIRSELVTLIEMGFTVEHLRSLHMRKDFSSEDISALHHLLKLQESNNSIDVITTFNSFYIPARELNLSPQICSELVKLISLGITIEHIRNLEIHNDFSQIDIDAFDYLITKEHNPPEEAIVHYNGFYTQARELGSSPTICLELITLIPFGITIGHLRNLKIPKELFSVAHIEAISLLIEEEKYHPDPAIRRINLTNSEQI